VSGFISTTGGFDSNAEYNARIALVLSFSWNFSKTHYIIWISSSSNL